MIRRGEETVGWTGEIFGVKAQEEDASSFRMLPRGRL